MHQYRSDLSPAREHGLPDTAIAIVGMSCRFAGARDLEAFWSLLRDGREGITTYSEDELRAAGVSAELLRKPGYVRRGAPLADMECFDATLFGLSPRDAAIMDPQHRHFLECAWEALENAGHTPQRFDGAIGVFAGSGHNAYLPYHLLTNPKLVRDVGLFLLRHTGNDKDFLATRASYLLDLKGPSVNVQTACSTSLVSIHMAVQSLLNGECDMALAGAASIELPHRQGYRFEEGEILSPDGHCRPFDAGSKGTVFGSGVALVVLRRLADAIEARDHIYAVVRGSAINNDGAGKVGYLAPSVEGQAKVIAEALAIADVDAGTISYVEAHGTGTPVGDPIEVAALTQAFRQSTDDVGYCAIGSVKGSIGHTDTAAGAAGLIKVALALHNAELPASLNFAAPNPECAFEGSPFYVQAERSAWGRADAPRRAGVSSLGVGGTNAHIIVEEAPPRAESGPSRAAQLILCSAKSEGALRDNCAALARQLAAEPSVKLADAAFTLGTGRTHLALRRAVVAEHAMEAAGKLSALAADAEPAVQCLVDRPVAFLFCGAGSQHADMARNLYQREPMFRARVDEALSVLDRIGVRDVRRWLFPAPSDRAQAVIEMERPSIALPALFTIQVALARFWISLGVRPRGMIGHSSGEYAAAHIAGVIDLESGLRIVSARGRLFETVGSGGMLSVPLREAELAPLLPPELSIAAINAPELCVLSGPSEAIARFQDALATREIEAQTVRISVAAHSPMLDPILPQFRKLMESIPLRAPQLPFVSNLTGDWIGEDEATDPGYWVRHLRQTVRFTDGLQRLLSEPEHVLLEVGPGRAMSSLARQHPERSRSQPILSSLPHPGQAIADDSFFWASLGQLWEQGVTIDWARYWSGEERNRLPLATYQFERQRHWLEAGSLGTLASEDAELPQRRENIEDWLYEPVWARRAATPGSAPPGPALVFHNDDRLGRAIIAELRARGTEAISVYGGDCFHQFGDRFVVNPASPGDYALLLDRLSEAGKLPRQIYHCWLVGTRSLFGDTGRLLDRGFHSLVAMAPEVARQLGEAKVDIAVVTDRLHRIAEERGLVPEKATALGAARVISTEYPTLRIRSIDVTIPRARDARDLRTVAQAVIGELAIEPERGAICYRRGERWVLDHCPVVRPGPGEKGKPALRCGATYVITGGLGGIGLTIARHLAQYYPGKIALVARNGLPPRDQWSDLLTRGTGDSRIAERIRGLMALEATGADVELVVADVSDRRAMRRVMREIRAKLGRITGVFHAAGALDDGLIETQPRSAMEEVLRPKLAGTQALAAALRPCPPEFLLLFSSISAFAGLPGQAAYAAANAYLDSFAQARHHHPQTRVLSIGWSQWREVGMAAALAGSSRSVGASSEPPEGGEIVDHPFLDRLHLLSEDEYIVTGTLSPDDHWLLGEHRVQGAGPLMPGTGYLELARAALALTEPGPAVLSDVTFLAPFSVSDGASREIRVHMQRRVGHDWRFTLLGRPVAGTGEDWVEHATGMARAHADPQAASLDASAIEARCPTVLKGVQEQSPVLQFGPRWTNVRQSAIGQDEALLRLALDPEFHSDLQGILLHPALLDLATAGAQSLIRDYHGASDFFAPFSYRRVALHRPLPARIVSHVRYRPAGEGQVQIAVFDVTLADEHGNVLAEIDEFTMMRVRDAAMLSRTSSGTSWHDSRSEEAPGARGASILPEEGVRLLSLLLSEPPRPHTIISPCDLAPALACLRAPRRARNPATASTQGTDRALPVGATETLIAELWSDLLGIECMGRTDDFFDLGGHSLLAVQFTNRLRKKLGRTVPLSAMLDNPTVEKLAHILDPGASAVEMRVSAGDRLDARAPSDVTTLRAGGSLTPIFFIHDGLGETLLYRGLALRLNPGRPVYGIEPLRAASGGFAHTRIEEMAANYVDRIRRVQQHGPYLLAGLCAGGVIAFEMGRQLQEQGEQVAFVGVIDAADVAAAKRPFYIARARLKRVSALAGRSSSLSLILALTRRAVNALVWEVDSRLRRARDRRLVGQLRSASESQNEAFARSSAQSIPFLKLYEVAHRQHRPAGLFTGGDVTLFKATCGNGAIDDVPYQEIYSDQALGWGRRVVHDVNVVLVPGGHGSALQEPHVMALARRFQDAIDSAMSGREDDKMLERDSHNGPLAVAAE